MGDSIMAFWNAPLDDPDHAGNACRAALRMMAALDRLNGELREEARATRRSFSPIRVGIGISTGECHVGNMGSDLRFDYSVIGDTVNVASRLERHSRTYAVPIILGQSTAATVPEMAKLEIDLIRVKGKARPERIYTLPLAARSSYDEAFQHLKTAQEAMLAAYRERRWTAALRQIRRCERCGSEEMKGYYRVMRERIRRYQKEPPPANWGGVYIAGTK